MHRALTEAQSNQDNVLATPKSVLSASLAQEALSIEPQQLLSILSGDQLFANAKWIRVSGLRNRRRNSLLFYSRRIFFSRRCEIEFA